MMCPPDYFEDIRERAKRRWEQLRSDPELAGPWHQLFKQVQSPRHVLSELLQNADDAGATEASCQVVGERFVFSHNGSDFTQEQFASLCRFGYSNKRALHTIGFRGVGFKSTFSIGPVVALYTPTLSVVFERERFTEPKWRDIREGQLNTRVCVDIEDLHRRRELEKNLADWAASPTSLLFFRNLQRVQIGESDLHWGSLGPGPVAGTEWMALHSDPDSAVLVARSGPETFPIDALREIRQERLLESEEGSEFPPCCVEIVVGAPGRLYVILPTGVETRLRFACNAPFIQDPARLKIKDPEISPTNRWLLERIGSLACSTMLSWLGSSQSSQAERAGAYGLLPPGGEKSTSLEGTCEEVVEAAFDQALGEGPFVLTEDGTLVQANAAVAVPGELFDVWPGDVAAKLLDENGRPPLAREVSAADRARLVARSAVEPVDKDDVLRALEAKHPPRPRTWRSLARLWAYVAPDITGYRYGVSREALRIVPVQGKDELYAAREVVRLGEKRLLQSAEDWTFLAQHLLVMNQNWPRYLAESRRAAGNVGDREEVESCFAVLQRLGLEESSDLPTVIESVAGAFFSGESISLVGCVRLAQIAAALGARVGVSFRFATEDRRLRPTSDGLLFDADGSLRELLPADWYATHALHPDYSREFRSCTAEQWSRWIQGGHALVQTCPHPVEVRRPVWGRKQIEDEIRRRGYTGAISLDGYRTTDFRIEDWDFQEKHWVYWKDLAENDETLWVRLVRLLLGNVARLPAHAMGARAVHIATTGNSKPVTYERLVPQWILRLRGQRCLSDSRGVARLPAELLRRTPETESFIEVEPFVHATLDRDETRPLLDALGVRSSPTGPDRLLDCLRALSKTPSPPVGEVEKWYRRLDHLVAECTTDDLTTVAKVLREERLIFTESSGWVPGAEVFILANEDDVPGAAVVRASVRDLMLWRRIGVPERPTADLAVRWLKALPSGEALTQSDLRRVRALLARHPQRIWGECGHWLNLCGEWVPAADLSFSLSMQSLLLYKHLHDWFKRRTADLQALSSEAIAEAPFASLPALSARIEDRMSTTLGLARRGEPAPWIEALGSGLRRIELQDAEETARVRRLAEELANTQYLSQVDVEVIAYLDGTPAGTPRRVDVIWLGRSLLVGAVSRPRRAKRIPEEIGLRFGRSELKPAFDYSIDRSPDEIREYLEENYELCPADVLKTSAESPEAISRVSGTQPVEEGVPKIGSVEPESVSAANLASTEAESALEPGPASDSARRRKVEAPRPSLIARFAAVRGFQAEGADRFRHPDGQWLGRAPDGPFTWELRTPAGELVRCYVPKEHCLERDALVLDADVWGLLDQKPDIYALVLVDATGGPIEVTGTELRAMREGEDLRLYPAAYRLVMNHDR